MNLRTDLAIEMKEMLETEELPGVECVEQSIDNATITRMQITNAQGEQAMGKPQGRYVTVEVPPFSADAQLFDGRLTAIAQELRNLLPKEGSILVVGLGNTFITPDALGPKAANYVLATRHIQGEIATAIGLSGLRSVAVAIPGVLGQTGVETGELIRGIVDTIHPAAVIVIDALASRRLSRLGCTVQMSDTGISPGSGVGNYRAPISQENLGVPVIAVGVPTVVDAATLAADLLGTQENQETLKETISPRGAQMMVTPREIDLVIERAARLIAMGINTCLHPEMDAKELFSLVS